MALWSDDAGATWSQTVSVEPSPVNKQLANAYSMTIVAPGMGVGGDPRVYAIYNMNVQVALRCLSTGRCTRYRTDFRPTACLNFYPPVHRPPARPLHLSTRSQNITHDGTHGPPITRRDMMGGFFMRYR
jgi:hypothetical protein